ncbi:TraR/DksA family transcriptional regulator [Criblamydia sequanensis]|uniref:DnaK suppressor protein n=1 Tax=Candidatus Criblamydia sequanensis CRIB-18 TaxID=1437425 RepID=A0A090E0Q2_9BACT|nr:TraR/DksA family transcriptional regulator [Criblamydia sequanensis]CDR34384.1 DnaK suppressor protein [Criblamydia sequanensis CRIB-18]
MPLKKKEVDQFKKRLEEMHQQILKQLRGTTEEVKKPDEATGYSQHQADQGTDDFDRTISLEVTTQEYNLLRQIERALQKIADNTYGICDVTGEEIPKARLDAIPYATMTVKAQEQLERGLI